LGGEGFGFLLGMEVAEMQVAGAARSATLGPSAKVKAHKLVERSFLDLDAKRSFSCVAVERPTERFVDMEVS